MLRNFALIALRDLIKHKMHTSINLIGLAVAVAICLLIFLFVRDELSFDDFHVHKDRVYHLLAVKPEADGSTRVDRVVPIPLAPLYDESLPGVEAATRWVRSHVIIRTGTEATADVVTYVDTSFFDILTFPLLYGDSATALSQRDAVVLGRRTAMAYFGREDVVGERLEYDVAGETHVAVVTGVAADIPHNSSIQFTILQRIDAYPWWERYQNNWDSWRCLTYVKLDAKANPADIEAAGATFLYDNLPPDKERPASPEDSTRLVLQPVDDMRLNLADRWQLDTASQIENSYILGGIALLVLIVACINYIILALGVSAGRVREVGMRKVLGAVSGQLARQFLVEALILAAMAVVLGIAIAELALPLFNDLTAKEYESSITVGWPLVLALGGLAAIIGFIAGAAPAAVMARIRPIQALKGQFRLGALSRISWLLVAVQFALTIFLIFGAATISRQMSYLNSTDLGFDKSNLLVIPTHASDGRSGQLVVERLRSVLETGSDILDVSGTSIAFTEGSDMNHWSRERDDLWAYVYEVDVNYLKTMGIELIGGRGFDPAYATDLERAVILNETAVRQYGLTNGAGDMLPEYTIGESKSEVTVVGVVKDHNFLSLRNVVDPMLIRLNSSSWLEYALVRIAPGRLALAMPRVAEIWRKTFPHLPYRPELLEDMLLEQYDAERRWQNVTLVASIIAVIVACMGLFGQVTLAIARRTKEIGIRKVLGASIMSVAVLLSGRLLVRISLAGLVSCAAAYYIMMRWLQQFPYRIELGVESFAVAIGAALFIAIITTGVRTIRAASSNPTESLRYE